jgi:hypothetical protein
LLPRVQRLDRGRLTQRAWMSPVKASTTIRPGEPAALYEPRFVMTCLMRV